MELALKIFQFVLSISILVVLHELGHFLPARWFRTRAEKFFLFFDPWFSIFSMKKIKGSWKFKFFSKNLPDTKVIEVNGEKKEVPLDLDELSDDDWRKYPENTKYGIGWLPMGGYVKIAGMVDESMDIEQLKKPAQSWEFRSKPAWQRLIIMLGGVTVNFFLAWFIFSALVFKNGESIFDSSKITEPLKYSTAAKKMGFHDGDEILTVDGKVQPNFRKLALDVLLSDHVTVLRDGKEVTFQTNDEGKAEAFQSPDPRGFLSPRINPVMDTIMYESTLKAGLKQGDIVAKIDGKEIEFNDELAPLVRPKAGKTVDLHVLRNGNPVDLTIPVKEDGTIGVLPYKQLLKYETHKDYSFGQSVTRGFTQTIESLTYQIKSFKLVFNKKVKGYKNVSGPIGIINQMPVSKDAHNNYSIDWDAFWAFTAMFSIWLAFINLIPIPGLDGGHVIFTLWEMITGKPVPQKVLENAQMIGVIFLLGLMVLIFGNDIFKLIVGKF